MLYIVRVIIEGASLGHILLNITYIHLSIKQIHNNRKRNNVFRCFQQTNLGGQSLSGKPVLLFSILSFLPKMIVFCFENRYYNHSREIKNPFCTNRGYLIRFAFSFFTMENNRLNSRFGGWNLNQRCKIVRKIDIVKTWFYDLYFFGERTC